MKRRRPVLSLTRETLLHLDTPSLRRVRGAGTGIDTDDTGGGGGGGGGDSETCVSCCSENDPSLCFVTCAG
mgnify:CR=1 FL=1